MSRRCLCLRSLKPVRRAVRNRSSSLKCHFYVRTRMLDDDEFLRLLYQSNLSPARRRRWHPWPRPFPLHFFLRQSLKRSRRSRWRSSISVVQRRTTIISLRFSTTVLCIWSASRSPSSINSVPMPSKKYSIVKLVFRRRPNRSTSWLESYKFSAIKQQKHVQSWCYPLLPALISTTNGRNKISECFYLTGFDRCIFLFLGKSRSDRKDRSVLSFVPAVSHWSNQKWNPPDPVSADHLLVVVRSTEDLHSTAEYPDSHRIMSTGQFDHISRHRWTESHYSPLHFLGQNHFSACRSHPPDTLGRDQSVYRITGWFLAGSVSSLGELYWTCDWQAWSCPFDRRHHHVVAWRRENIRPQWSFDHRSSCFPPSVVAKRSVVQSIPFRYANWFPRLWEERAVRVEWSYRVTFSSIQERIPSARTSSHGSPSSCVVQFTP